jgi:hypothetical protein
VQTLHGRTGKAALVVVKTAAGCIPNTAYVYGEVGRRNALVVARAIQGVRWESPIKMPTPKTSSAWKLPLCVAKVLCWFTRVIFGERGTMRARSLTLASKFEATT